MGCLSLSPGYTGNWVYTSNLQQTCIYIKHFFIYFKYSTFYIAYVKKIVHMKCVYYNLNLFQISKLIQIVQYIIFIDIWAEKIPIFYLYLCLITDLKTFGKF